MESTPQSGPARSPAKKFRPIKRDSGIADRADEVVDRRVRGHRLVRPGPPELDRGEAGLLGRRRPLQERELGEQHRAVGGVAGVRGSSCSTRLIFRIVETIFCLTEAYWVRAVAVNRPNARSGSIGTRSVSRKDPAGLVAVTRQ